VGHWIRKRGGIDFLIFASLLAHEYIYERRRLGEQALMVLTTTTTTGSQGKKGAAPSKDRQDDPSVLVPGGNFGKIVQCLRAWLLSSAL